MKLINTDETIHISIFGERIEEASLEEMIIVEFLDAYAEGGCPEVLEIE